MKHSAIVLAAWLACVPTAFSWEPIAGSRPTWDGATVTYTLERSGSDDLGSATEAEVTEAMGSWGQLSCTGLRIDYGGLTDDSPSAVDGRFVLGFIESGWQEGSGVLGVTATRYNGSRLVEADIAFNGDDWTWSTGRGDIRSQTCNAATIIGHEGGHFFGIGHSGDTGALMFAAYSGGITPIGPDDQEAICTLYPGTPQPPPTCETAGCPANEECVMGACVPVAGRPGSLCAPCGGAADCGDASDACLLYPDGNSACGSACGTCPNGFACAAVQGLSAPQCVRLVDGVETCDGYLPVPPTPPGPTPDAGVGGNAVAPDAGPSPPPGTLGAECEFNSDCGSGLCVDHQGRRVCTETCDNDCQTGFACVDYETMGLCMPDQAARTVGGTIRGGCHAAPGRTVPLGAAFGVLIVLGLLCRKRR